MNRVTNATKRAGLLAAVLAVFPVWGQPDAEKTIDQELRIMSQILEESLDHSDVAPWHGVGWGASFLDSKVKAQYVPSVGAIFTLDVNFPIVEPEKIDKEESSDGDESSDLWERFSKRSRPAWPPRIARREFSGVGIQIRKNEDGEVEIVSVLPDSPAREAGLEHGDIIVKVGEDETVAMELGELSENIRGPQGSTVHIEVRRAGEESGESEQLEFEIERVRMPVEDDTLAGNARRILYRALGRSSGDSDDDHPQYLRLDGRRGRAGDRSRNRVIDNDRLRVVLGDVTGVLSREYDAENVARLRASLIDAVAKYGHRIEHLDNTERVLVIVNAPSNATHTAGPFSVSGIIPRSGGQGGFGGGVGFGSGGGPIVYSSPRNRAQDSDHMMLSFDKSDLTAATDADSLEPLVADTRY